MPSGFFVFVRFSVRTMIHFEPACVPAVVLHFCNTTSVSLCGFVSLSYRRCSLPTFRTYQRTMVFSYPTIMASVVSSSPRPHRLVATWMLHALLFSSDDFFPFRCRLSCILAYLFFQRFRWALDSASDAFKLLLLCRDLTLSAIGVPLIAPVGPI